MKQEFGRIVGPGQVTDDPAVLARFAKDRSFAPEKTPALSVSPKTAEEVQLLINLAREKKARLVPVSSVAPGFRGDAVPEVDGAVIVDLSGMKEIMWINRRNRVALVEAGVTFGELEPELEKQGMRTMMPLLPRAGKSIVGAFMEREPFTVPKYAWDLGDPVASSEIILGDGYKMRTGGGAGPAPTLEGQRKVGGAHKLPLSPAGMDVKRVAQGSCGSIGICTWQALRCELLPEHEKVFFVGEKTLPKLVKAAYRLLYLRMIDEQFIVDRTNFACLIEKDPKKIDALIKKLPEWIMVLSISGSGTNAKGQFEYKQGDLADEAKALNIELSHEMAGFTDEMYQETILRKVSPEPFWKLRKKGDCREIFFLTNLSRAPEFVKEAKKIAKKHQVDFKNVGVYLQQQIQGTACHMEFDIYADAKDMDKVEKFYQEFSEKIFTMGGYFSRPYGMWSDLVYPHAETFVKYARGMKRLFDPALILNPEKLCFKGM